MRDTFRDRHAAAHNDSVTMSVKVLQVLSQLVITGYWQQIPDTDYYGIAVQIPHGSNLIVHDDRNAHFMCTFYGYDDKEAMGFAIGMELNIIP